MQPLISFVIPMYNSEKTIIRCINSILKADTKDIEVVVVDDGSTDNSVEVCRNEFEGNNKVKIYQQNNKGVSAARNQGILSACGKFIMFVDSDDYIDEKALSNCIDKLSSDDRMIFFGYARVVGNKTINYQMEESFFKTDDLTDQVKKQLYDTCILHNIGTKIYPRKLLVDNNIQFESSIAVYEDIIFTLKALNKAREVFMCNEVVYFYIITKGSLNHSYRKNYFKAIKLLDDELTCCKYDTQFTAWVYINKCIRTIMNEMLLKSGKSQKEVIKCIIEDDRLKKCMQENISYKIKPYYRLLLILIQYRLTGAIYVYCKCLVWLEARIGS